MKMKKIFNLVFATFLALSSFALAPSAVFAEGEETTTPETWLQLSPTATTVILRSGDTITGDSLDCDNDTKEGCVIKVTNIGSRPFRYRVYTSPYVVENDGTVNFDENSSKSYTQISRWITFDDGNGNYQKELTKSINPGESQTIGYRIDVPEDIPGGAQYAAIWAQTLNEEQQTSTGVQTISQAGMVISGRSIGTTRQTAELSDYKFTRFAFSGPLDAHAHIKNTGNTDFDIHYSYIARTVFGKELYNDTKSIIAFPESDHDVDVSWESTPLLGIFQVEFNVDAGDTKISEQHIVAIIPIFVVILLILLLTVIIVWIIIIIRKRKERKARTLV